MAQTLEQHKAAVLAANPTPTPTWYLYADHPAHVHDDQAVARFEMSFGGEDFVYEIHLQIASTYVTWGARSVQDPFGARDNQRRTYRTWAEFKVGFLAEWETICGYGRELMAGESLARAVLAEDGITAPPAPVATAATATLAGLMPHSAWTSDWTLAPTFAPNTFAYAFNALNDTFVPVAELGFAGQTVFWKHGQDAYVGMVPVITINSGENVITITVVSADGQNAKTYTLTVTRA